MTLIGFALMLLIGIVAGLAFYSLLGRGRLRPLDAVWAVVFGIFGAYAGSRLFDFVSAKGPEVEGLYVLTAIAGAIVLSAALVYGLLRAPQAQRAQAVDDPPIAHFLFGDTRAAVLWLAVRLYVGFEWLNAGREKLTDDGWMKGGSALKSYFERAVAVPKPPARPSITYGWYRDFLQYMLDHQWYAWFAKLVAMGETLIGIALIIGLFVGIAAFFGTLMNFNFMLAGSASTNPVLFGLAVFLILAWKIAGYWGLDRYVMPMLGAPWKPGRAFRHQQGVATS